MLARVLKYTVGGGGDQFNKIYQSLRHGHTLWPNNSTPSDSFGGNNPNLKKPHIRISIKELFIRYQNLGIPKCLPIKE